MPNFITRLFSSGATKLVEGIGTVLDELITSKDEKLAAELKIKELIAKHEVEMEKEITSRWSSDMNSDSWLSKNVRPMVLVFLVGVAGMAQMLHRQNIAQQKMSGSL